MRIIGGQYRGKRLQTPEDRSIRPTSDRARESLFNILDHADLIRDAIFLDLFCGTGAVGLEAFSRGAAEVWLIDLDTTLAAKNTAGFGRPSNLHVRRQDATRLGKPPTRFDLVFLDPPYGSGLASEVLTGLRRSWLADGAWIMVELAAKDFFDPPPGFRWDQERRYGAAKLIFLRLES